MMKPAGATFSLSYPFRLTIHRDFLTGFHKRKLAKADAARKKAQEREKQERLEARRDVCSVYIIIAPTLTSDSLAATASVA